MLEMSETPGATSAYRDTQFGVIPGQKPWRPSSGTAESRNLVVSREFGGPVVWRPSSGTAESRNLAIRVPTADLKMVAAVLRDGRESQQRMQWWMRPGQGCGGRPPGRPRVATTARRPGTPPRWCGGRPPGRPRVATPRAGAGSRTARWWRPSSGTAESRNVLSTTPETRAVPWRPSSGTAESRNDSGRAVRHVPRAVAAVLRDGRESQPKSGPGPRPGGVVAAVLRDGRES